MWLSSAAGAAVGHPDPFRPSLRPQQLGGVGEVVQLDQAPVAQGSPWGVEQLVRVVDVSAPLTRPRRGRLRKTHVEHVFDYTRSGSVRGSLIRLRSVASVTLPLSDSIAQNAHPFVALPARTAHPAADGVL